jgi:hypothetical protein
MPQQLIDHEIMEVLALTLAIQDVTIRLSVYNGQDAVMNYSLH